MVVSDFPPMHLFPDVLENSCVGWDMLMWEKPTVVNILKSRRGEDKSPDCKDFSTGTVTLKKKIHPLPSEEYFFETFLEFNSCSWWVPVREPYNSQTLVCFHDHNISLQAIPSWNPQRNNSLKYIYTLVLTISFLIFLLLAKAILKSMLANKCLNRLLLQSLVFSSAINFLIASDYGSV